MGVTREDLLPEESSFDDFSGPIIDARFEVIKEYAEKMNAQPGKEPISLVCYVQASGFETNVKLGGFSCGNAEKWDIAQGGSELLPLKGTSKIHAKSNLGVFLNELYKCAGEGDKSKGVNVLVQRGFKPTQAAFYLGLDSRWLRKILPNPVDENKTVSVQVATDYLKITDISKTAPTASPAKGPAAEYTEADVAWIQKIAEGKSEPELRKFVAHLPKDQQPSPAFQTFLFNRGGFAKLEVAGKLVKDPGGSGKYI